MNIIRHAVRCLMTMSVLIPVGLAPTLTLAADAPEKPAVAPPSIATVHSTYGKLPLSFEANQGQWDSAVQFVTRGQGLTLFVTPNEAVLSVQTGEATDQRSMGNSMQQKPVSETAPLSQSVVRMNFAGADPAAKVVGLEPLPGIVNYFIGHDPAKWHTNIPTYQKIGYKDVYPGIDLVYYGNEGRLEYDFIVAPGVDPTQIRVAFEGAEHLAVDQAGDLVLTVASTEAAAGTAPTLRLQKPVVYQRDAQGEKHLLAGSYVLLATEPSAARASSVAVQPRTTPKVAFQVAAYDRSRPLIIDPVLSWAIYLVGNHFDHGLGIAVDTAGNAYVTGLTQSSNFPGTAGSAMQSILNGGADAFVAKVNAAGTALVYSTYLGGSDADVGYGIAVDAAGNAYVTGSTTSTDFPGTAGSAIQSTLNGDVDVFVTKLNAAGTAIVYSTYLGGSGFEEAYGMALDAAGNIYVTGRTLSSDFLSTAGSPIQSTYGGNEDAFVAKISDGPSSIPFAAFGPKAEIKVRDQEFELKATFTLGAGNNGIAPLTEAVTVQVGPFMTTIPAGSFKSHKGRFKFEGLINGVQLEVELRSLILGNDYELKLEGQGADLTGSTNPVTVSVTIGNDSGSKAITAKMK